MTLETEPSLTLEAAQVGLLALHRLLPERSLPELIVAASTADHPVHRAMLHVAECPGCTAAALVSTGFLCRRGRQLAAACATPRSRTTRCPSPSRPLIVLPGGRPALTEGIPSDG